MRPTRITVGVLLIVGCAWMLFTIFAFATLTAGGLEDDSPEWWPTVLEAMFRAPETFNVLAGPAGGIGLCLYHPGMKMTVDRPAPRHLSGPSPAGRQSEATVDGKAFAQSRRDESRCEGVPRLVWLELEGRDRRTVAM